LAERNGRDQHQPPAQPIPGIHHKVPDGPALIVKIEMLHFADFSIFGPHREAIKIRDIS